MRRLAKGWMGSRSLASRVTLLTAGAVGVIVALLAIGSFITVRAQMTSSVDKSLLARAHAASTLFASVPSTILPSWILGAGDIRVAAMDSTGAVYIPEADPRHFPGLGKAQLTVARGQDQSSVITAYQDGHEYRIAAVPLPRQQGAMIVAQSLDSERVMLEHLALIMIIVGGLGVIAAAGAGWGVATGGLRPVRQLTSDVERIARTEDLTPLPVSGDDEVARLASSFNGLLVALSASRDRQRKLVADAGHELRTPLTSMRTNIDLLTQAGASLRPKQRSELLADIRAQMEELTTLIGDLVELAREEQTSAPLVPVELPEVVDRAVERVRLRAASVQWNVELESWWVVGDLAGIERAVTNLLDNAAKWSPTDGTVTVTLARGTLTVDDEGPGIADEDLPHVFERFYRSPDARSMPGSGLGLSIVEQVAVQHGGSVTVAHAPEGGARFALFLPGSPSPVPMAPATA